jgi:hypothetical protein
MRQPTISPRRWPTVRPYVLLFLLLSVVYHSNLRPIASGDSLPASLVPFSLLLDRSRALDRFGPYIHQHVANVSTEHPNNVTHWYSIYPVAGPALSTPLYLPLTLIPWVARQPPGTLIAVARIFEKVVAVALASASAAALLLLLRRLTSQRTALMLTLVFALATGNWSTSSQALWQHTYGQLAIIACLYFIERLSADPSKSRWYWLAGLSAACAVAIRPTNLALLPALALVLGFQPARPMHYVRVFSTPALALLLTAGYNFSVFGSIAGGYPVRSDGSPFNGLTGILLSPGRGLLIYTPIVLFAFFALAPAARETRRRHRLVPIAAAAFSILQISLIAVWPVWWGGY